MDRKTLLGKLSIVEPAISSRELIPILNHIWFTGTRVMAFNDQIAISTDLKTEFRGAVPGPLLLGLLRKSRGENVIFEPDDNSVLIKVGGSKITMALLPPEQFVHEMPKSPTEDEDLARPVKDRKVQPWEQLVTGVDCCLHSITAHDSSDPNQLGMTIIPDGEDLHLYATDNSTITHCLVDLGRKTNLRDRVILCRPFCEQLVTLTQAGNNGFKGRTRLAVRNDHAIATIGDMTLFGRLISNTQPLDFQEIIAHHVEENIKLLQIPTALRGALERAELLTSAPMAETKATIEVKGGVMTISSKTGNSELRDRVFDKDRKLLKTHPDVTVRMNPKLLKDGEARFDRFLVTEKCAIMRKDGAVYLVAATSA